MAFSFCPKRFSKINQPPKQLIKLNKRSLLENLIISFVKNNKTIENIFQINKEFYKIFNKNRLEMES